MEIRKLFSFKGSHTVRNCTSELCKFSLHGHRYQLEVYVKSTPNGQGKILDNGQMVYDFGLTKKSLKEFIKAFDNTYAMWSKESDYFKTSIKTINKRWVDLPFSPSAESLSIMFLKVFDKIISSTQTANGEKDIYISKVKVHETTTGYATAFREDLASIDYDIKDIVFSPTIEAELSDLFKQVV